MKYNGTGWENEQIVQSAVSPASVPVLSMNSTSGDFYCFWAGSDNCIWYKKNSGGVWDSTPRILVNESGETLTRLDGVNAFHEFTDYCGVLYETEQQSPYNIKFQFVSPPDTPPQVNDIALTNPTAFRNVVGRGFQLQLNMTVVNLGNLLGTFNVTVYANTTCIASQNVTTTNGNSTTLAFTCNTTSLPYGNYTISAYAWPVSGQTDTLENNFTLGVVHVTIPGDINGDFKVNLADLVALAQAYGSKPGDTNWNANADIDGNGVVGLSDLVILAQNYGKTA
jgi:hypothetical protein